MKTSGKAWFLGAIVGVAALAACGDDADETGGTTTLDAGGTGFDAATADSSQPQLDSSTVDAATDTTVAAPAVTPLATTRIANAINPYGLVYATDGFLYASGATIDELGERVLAVWRFKDGVRDTTFGTGGVLTVDIPGTESSFDIVEVSAGNFVVQAVTSGTAGKVYLVKMTKVVGGTFTFGTPTPVDFDWTDGDFTTWPGANPPVIATSWAIAVDRSAAATPKIVVFASGAPAKGRLGKAGGTQAGIQRIDNDRWIARVLASTLAPDPAFNGGKPYSVDIDGAEVGDNGRRGIVLADGTIVSAGYSAFTNGNAIALIRLLPSGAIDPAFGFGTTTAGLGHTRYNPFTTVAGGFSEAYAVGRQSSGRLVTAGYGTSNFNAPSIGVDLLSFGFKADGADATYGKLGALVWQSETDKAAGLGAGPYVERGRALAVLPDDRVVIAGVYDDYATIYVGDKNGKADTSSGTNGVIQYTFPAGFFNLVVSPDGKQVAATTQSINQSADAGAPLGSVLATLKVGQ